MIELVSEAIGRIFRSKAGKYLVYLPKALVTDTKFPFKDWQPNPRSIHGKSIPVKISFDPEASEALGRRLFIEEVEEDG